MLEPMNTLIVRYRVSLTHVARQVLATGLVVGGIAAVDSADSVFVDFGGAVVLTAGILGFARAFWFLTDTMLTPYRKPNHAEVEASQRMRRLGLRHKPYPQYAWEVCESDAGSSEPVVRIYRCDPITDQPVGRPWGRASKITSADGELVQDIALDEKGEPVMTTVRVRSMRLADPSETAFVSDEDIEAITIAERHTSLLNEKAKEQWKARRRARKGASLPTSNHRVDALNRMRPAKRRLLAR